MKPGRLLLLLVTGGAVVAFRLFACERLMPTRPVAHTHEDASAPSAIAASSSARPVGARAPEAHAPPVAPRFDKATLLANGHVLMPAKDVVYDWDPRAPTPLRSMSLGDAGPAHTSSFTPLGGRRFVVAKADEGDNVSFELWDAERLVVLRALGTYVVEDPVVDFSRDGKRLMLLACAAPRGGARSCEVGVHDLATGDLVHRSKVAPLTVVGPNRVAGRISPAGTYFALSGDEFPTVAYDAATGRQVYRNTDLLEADIDDELLHFAFVDDRRLLTASARSGLRLTDLSTGRATTRPLFASAASGAPVYGSHDLRVLTSPTTPATHAATELTRPDGSFAVSLFSFDTGSGHDIPVPPQVCSRFCAMRWSGPRELVLLPNVEGTPLEVRIDAATGSAVTEPARDPAPFDVFEAQQVHGDFDKYETSKWHPEDRSAAYPKGALVTPKGVRIDLTTVDMAALTSAVGDHFLFDGLRGMVLFRSDGERAELAGPPPPP